jgi:hypothetical protein
MTEIETPKNAGFVDRGYNHSKKQKRLEEEEREIARLEAIARGEEAEDEEEEETQELVEETSEVEEATEESDLNLSKEEKSFKKRYGDLRRHMQEKEKEWEKKFNELKNSNQTKSIVPPKSDEDIAAWSKRYPDIAGIVETIAKKKAQEMFESADSRLRELDRISEEARIEKAEAAIRKAHSDFDALRDSDEFHTWADEQPKWVQDALYENSDDPASVIRVIDLYKVDKGLTTKDRKSSTKNAAKAVGARSKTSIDAAQTRGTFSESQVARMSMKEYEASEEAILEAQRNGKFVYDLSGGAR